MIAGFLCALAYYFSMTFLLQAQNLTKAYGSIIALDNLSFSLSRGEIVGLLGPNGAGKTTAIHIFLGLLTPSSGEVSVLGLSPIKDHHVIASRINFSSAYVNLPSNLKVRENLKIFSMLYNVEKAQEKIEKFLHLFEIEHLNNRLTGALSAGEKTRLNLCKALLNDPELLLLDEPTASLDPEVADKVKVTLKNIQKERGMGILYTSHNMKEVEELCDRVMFLHHGKTMAEGSPQEVMRQYQSGNLDDVFIKLVRQSGFVNSL